MNSILRDDLNRYFMQFPNIEIKGTAQSGAMFDLSENRRYALWRWWGEPLKPAVAMNFIMLNPSTASEFDDDPTIRKCVGFASRRGCNMIAVTNLFAWRSPCPQEIYALRQYDAIGMHNDDVIVRVANHCDGTVLAWGNDGALWDRGRTVSNLLTHKLCQAVFHLGELTKKGQPRHPLYLPYNSEWKEFGR